MYFNPDVANVRLNGMEIVRISGMYLRNLDDSAKRNYDVVLAAVSNDGVALQWAAPDLKD